MTIFVPSAGNLLYMFLTIVESGKLQISVRISKNGQALPSSNVVPQDSCNHVAHAQEQPLYTHLPCTMIHILPFTRDPNPSRRMIQFHHAFEMPDRHFARPVIQGGLDDDTQPIRSGPARNRPWNIVLTCARMGTGSIAPHGRTIGTRAGLNLDVHRCFVHGAYSCT